MTKLREYINFIVTCLGLLSRDKLLFGLFLSLSGVAALTEGVGVSMLVPILEAQSNNTSMFQNIPVLKYASMFFEGMGQREKLQSVALILGSMLVARGVLLYCVEVLAGIIPLRLQKSLFARGYSSILGVEYSYVTEKDVGEHINGLREWAMRVTNVLINFGNMIFNLILFVVYTGLMLLLSWKLALFAVAFVLVLSVMLKMYTTNVLKAGGRVVSEKDAKLGELIYETLSGMKVVKASAAEDVMANRYGKHLEDKTQTSIRMALYQAVTHPFLTTSAGIFICVLLFSGSSIYEGVENWLGGLLMFLFLLMRLLVPVSQINATRARIMSHMHALDKLQNFYAETERRRQRSGSLPFEGAARRIDFDHVSFRYPGGDDAVIHDLTMSIHAGEMVAVVGPSGAGKSTLVALLARFYDPQGGTIKVDGVDLREFDVNSLRRKLSIVSQDTFIFNDTVKSNIAFPVSNVSDDEIRHAAELAAADEFIKNLPEQYETRLGDRGVRLSGGQQQRISIARAILRDPSFMILDEATSHLDTFTEQAIQNAVEFLRKDRTILVIAHRLSTIQRADRVVVLKEGRVVEQGTHTQLMNAKGAYWEMVSHQQLDLVAD